MPLPDNAVRKAVRRPNKAISYLWDRFEEIITDRFGWKPFEQQWDVLIVLDACRYDLACDSEATDAFGEPRRIWSLGGNSSVWLNRAFDSSTPEQLASTAYISANPFTNVVPESKLAMIDNVLEYGFDPDQGTVPPRVMTDRAITTIRDGSADRYIIHYMQPHPPPVRTVEESAGFEHDIIPPNKGGGETNYWQEAKNGLRDGEMITQAYKNNLSPVVREVELLLENVNANDVVITADHGNFLGESGRWGHGYATSLHPALRIVPCFQTTATNEHTHEPAEYERESANKTRLERLKALGYR